MHSVSIFHPSCCIATTVAFAAARCGHHYSASYHALGYVCDNVGPLAGRTYRGPDEAASAGLDTANASSPEAANLAQLYKEAEMDSLQEAPLKQPHRTMT